MYALPITLSSAIFRFALSNREPWSYIDGRMATAENPFVQVPVLHDRALVLRALERARWILQHAATDLGVSRQALYDAMDRLGIERQPPDPRAWNARRKPHRA